MDREKFIQSSVRIRHYEKKLLTKQQFERLSDAKNLEDAIRLLNETSYSNDISKIDRVENYEQFLSSTLDETYKEVLGISPDKSLVEILSYKYKFHNVKVAVKEYILNEKFDSMYCILDDKEIDEFRNILEKDMDNEFSKVYTECISLYEETKDPQDIDIFVDKKYFERVLEISKKFNLKVIEDFFTATIDFINMRTFIRCKRQNQSKSVLEKVLISGGEMQISDIISIFYDDIEVISSKFKNYKIGKTLSLIIEDYKNSGSFTMFEKFMDDYLSGIISNTKSIHYGAEVIFAYLYAKELEIKNLRIILVGKVNGLSSEFIRERLRESYA